MLAPMEIGASMRLFRIVRMKRDISGLLFDYLDFFQAFDDVKVYYDNGQDIVKKALDQSFGFVLSKVIFTSPPFGLI